MASKHAAKPSLLHLICRAPDLARLGLLLAFIGSGSVAAADEIVAPFKASGGGAACQGVSGYAPVFEVRRAFLWRSEWLGQIKGDPASQAAIITQLLPQAEKMLKLDPLFLVSKTNTPTKGDKHDYYSMAPYWWPTLGKSVGAPYTRNDSKVNPERDGMGYNARNLSKLSDAVLTLSLAHYYSYDQRFASPAALLIRTWFLGPATRMNLNLAYAQAIPGVSDGRPEGVIDAQHFMPIIESVGLLTPSGVLSRAKREALEVWF